MSRNQIKPRTQTAMNLTESNPHLRKQSQIAEARKQFEESEWRLSFLRCIEPEKPQLPTPDQLLSWQQKPLLGLN